MPVLGKHTLTRYLGSECERQLRILLSPDTGPKPSERERNGMPPKQPPLPGLNAIAEAGDEWAAGRLAELDTILGPVLVGTRKRSTRTTGIEFAPTALQVNLGSAAPQTFLAEHEFEVGATFQAAFGVGPCVTQFGLTFQRLRPDLIEVRAAGISPQHVRPDGSVANLPNGDSRRQLRVIDIKLTANPGPGYLAEVVYYSVALAGWLVDIGLDADFVVCPDPAIWPGSHEASALVAAQRQAKANVRALTTAEGLDAVYADLVAAPLPVFVSRLQHFFRTTLPGVLATPWQALPFHVTSRCVGCDFLGQDWGPNSGVDPLHCLPTANATGHLSQIPFVSRGASQLLFKAGLATVTSVAATTPADSVYDQHHSLRGQRTVISSRAAALTNGSTTGVAPHSGTSAVLPSWSDLNVYVTADFDASSAITLAFGVSAFWSQPTSPSVKREPDHPRKVWKAQTFLVDSKSLQREEQVVLQFLEHIDNILEFVRQDDQKRGATAAKSQTTVQFFLWDDLTYRHLCRVVGRHLGAVLASRHGVRVLAWLFPPEDVLPNARLLADPVITIVGDAVRSLLALPIPHHYSLLETARNYHSNGLQPPVNEFSMPHHHENRLSDQIPSERAHDIWNRGPRFPQSVKNLDWAVGTRLRALEEVTKRLRTDLKASLRRRAPAHSVLTAPANVGKMTADELLLYAFTRLNAAVDAQETARRRAMPAHEREARFSAARLSERLTGPRRSAALTALGVTPHATYEVYTVRSNSAQANFKEGDFLCAVVPEDKVEVLDWTVSRLVYDRTKDRAQADLYGDAQRVRMSDVLNATLVRLDRDKNLAVVRMDSTQRLAREQLIRDGHIALDHNVSLEKITKDFLSGKLEATLKAIGRTPKAVDSPIAARAVGTTANPRKTAAVAVQDVIWDAPAMAATSVPRDAAAAKAALVRCGRPLNISQWSAFEHALTHRLSLIWGPPGTGKSRTVTNLIVGAAHDAVTSGKPLRVLVTASTYSAIDNVLTEVGETAARMLPAVQVWRGRSESREAATGPVVDCVIDRKARTGSPQQMLTGRLVSPAANVTIVGASPQQVHKLAVSAGSPVTPLFDLIVVDEASQIDVANAILSLAALAESGSVVVAGDPLQLPPIHRVDPPKGTENLVGSVYDFLAQHHGVPEQPLMVNYRSNDEIVALARDAAYPPGLQANSPHLRLNLLSPVPSGDRPPSGWPAPLAWSPDLPALLNPQQPVTCVVYRDGLSGQSNAFEAQVVAGLAWLLNGRLADRLTGEVDAAGNPLTTSANPFSTDGLFQSGLGVVTPHRAQQSLITSLLATTLPGVDPGVIRSAVDTVERFQGQQRNIIIASYAVGDPDTIADEDEFLQSLNRFNVMASRARAKVIVLISEELVQHLPVDIEVLRASGLLKAFVDTRCRNRRDISLSVQEDSGPHAVQASLRWS